jgi:hypothetical protein
MPKSRPNEGAEAGGRGGAIAFQGGVLDGGVEEGGKGRDVEMGGGEPGEGAEEEGESGESEDEEGEEPASSEEEEGSEGAFDPEYVLLDPISLKETPIWKDELRNIPELQIWYRQSRAARGVPRRHSTNAGDTSALSVPTPPAGCQLPAPIRLVVW